ncbi:MAG: glycoside hydrolase, partial [Melioribacteraceae bacterium]|nr:glycoside hydrolase [Melioribacteraceae bacterium]
MNFKRIFLSGLLAVSFAGCEKDNFTDPNDPKYDAEPDLITLNLDNTFQTIDHFGASGGFQDQWVGVWPDASREPVAKLLFSSELDNNGNPEGIGLSMWRVNIGDGSMDQANNGFRPSSWFRETESFLSSDGEYDWSKQEGVQWFVQKAYEYGVPSFTA